MRNRTTTALVLVSLMLVACAGEVGTELDAETSEAIDQVDSEISQLADEIDAADLQEDLETAWQTLETQLRDAVDALRSGEAVDTDAVQGQIQEFQESFDSAGIDTDIQQAWNQLRTNIEDLLAGIG